MTDVAIAQTPLRNDRAGQTLGREIRDRLRGAEPDAVVVFASPRNRYPLLLEALAEACRPRLLVGCSSAGEFTDRQAGEGLTCAVALRSPDMQFAAGLALGVRADPAGAACKLAASFTGLGSQAYRHRTALILTDALAGHADVLVEELALRTAGMYRFVGGGAADDARFQQTHVFHGTEAYQDAVVGLEMLSHKPIGVGVRHGWSPASPPLRVTAAEGMRVESLNAAPAVEVFDEHARATGQPFDHRDPLPFFLHNVLGVRAGDGHRLRVPLGVEEDGSVLCAAEVPEGATAHIMKVGGSSAAEAAAAAARDALSQVHGHRPKVALFFDCAATRLRLGAEFGRELEALGKELGPVPFAGCNTYGQIARAEGQFSGFHNCTAVVCVIPD